MSFQKIHKELLRLSSKERAINMQRFFKTGKGEYGEGDFFHGVSVPQQRIVAKNFTRVSDSDTIVSLLHSKFHE